MSVTQTLSSLTIGVQGPNAGCTLSGNYTQTGSSGNSSGNFSCTDGIPPGPAVVAGMQMTAIGFTAQFGVNAPQCFLLGSLSGILISGP